MNYRYLLTTLFLLFLVACTPQADPTDPGTGPYPDPGVGRHGKSCRRTYRQPLRRKTRR